MAREHTNTHTRTLQRRLHQCQSVCPRYAAGALHLALKWSMMAANRGQTKRGRQGERVSDSGATSLRSVAGTEKEARNLYCTQIKFISLTCRHAKPGELIQISTLNIHTHTRTFSFSPYRLNPSHKQRVNELPRRLSSPMLSNAWLG